MKILDISKISYEAVRAYNQQVFGDFSEPPWDRAPAKVQQYNLDRTQFCIENRRAPASSWHDRWMNSLLLDGWKKAEFTDPAQKLHVRLIPWTLLPQTEQVRDKLFMRVVEALLESL